MATRENTSSGRRFSLRIALLAVLLTLLLLAVLGVLVIRQQGVQGESSLQRPTVLQARQIGRDSLQRNKTPGP